MYLYLISQNVNDEYDDYDSAIVCADSELDARMMHPSGCAWGSKERALYDDWCDLKDVQVQILGTAANNLPRGVVLASYNAG